MRLERLGNVDSYVVQRGACEIGDIALCRLLNVVDDAVGRFEQGLVCATPWSTWKRSQSIPMSAR